MDNGKNVSASESEGIYLRDLADAFNLQSEDIGALELLRERVESAASKMRAAIVE